MIQLTDKAVAKRTADELEKHHWDAFQVTQKIKPEKIPVQTLVEKPCLEN